MIFDGHLCFKTKIILISQTPKEREVAIMQQINKWTNNKYIYSSFRKKKVKFELAGENIQKVTL